MAELRGTITLHRTENGDVEVDLTELPAGTATLLLTSDEAVMLANEFMLKAGRMGVLGVPGTSGARP